MFFFLFCLLEQQETVCQHNLRLLEKAKRILSLTLVTLFTEVHLSEVDKNSTHSLLSDSESDYVEENATFVVFMQFLICMI